MVGLPPMVVPPLHHVRVAGCHVGLAKPFEDLVVAPEHLHQEAALIRDHPQRLNHNATNHKYSPPIRPTCRSVHPIEPATRARPLSPRPRSSWSNPCTRKKRCDSPSR